MTDSELVLGPPDILVSTPACISKCFSADVLQRASIDDSLEILVLDEADLLLSYGYEDDIKALTPRTLKCQCLLMSATSSADIEKLKKLTLHNCIILTLPEVGNITDEVIPKSIQQFWLLCFLGIRADKTMATSSSSTSFSPSSNPPGTISQTPILLLKDLVSVKLDATNYVIWKYQILSIFESYSLLDMVDGTSSPPAQYLADANGESSLCVNPLYKQWKARDQALKTLINATLSPSAITLVIGQTTAQGVWQVLERRYTSLSRTHVLSLKAELDRVKKSSTETMTVYLDRVKEIRDKLGSVGVNVDDEDLLHVVLKGLTPEGRGGRSSNRGRGGRNSFGSNRGGYPSNPQGFSQSYNSPGTFNGSSQRPQCQICGKTGHLALDCFHRMNFAYQGRQPPAKLAAIASTNMSNAINASSSTQSSWISDTGATDHFTPDISHIPDCYEYCGNEQITMLPFSFDAHKFQIKDLSSGKLLYNGLSEHGLYPIHGAILPESSSPKFPKSFHTSATDASSKLWHSRLGHPQQIVLQHVLHKHLSLPVSHNNSVCSHCLAGKMHQLPFPKSVSITSRPLEIVHSDVWGPAPITSNNGTRYYFTCPHTSQQNGVAERKHRHIVDMGLTLMSQASLPLTFWPYAFFHLCVSHQQTSFPSTEASFLLGNVSLVLSLLILPFVVLVVPVILYFDPTLNTSFFPDLSNSSSMSIPVHCTVSAPLSMPTPVHSPLSSSTVPLAVNSHPMQTRAKSGISKKKQWHDAMASEFAALQRQSTWSLVPPSPDQHIIGCHWVFKLKRNSDGSVARYKARLVAQGNHQLPGIDFDETFSPVVKPATVRLMLSIAAQHQWSLRQLDVSNAFLHGSLKECVYMRQPPGFVDTASPSHVCFLHKVQFMGSVKLLVLGLRSFLLIFLPSASLPPRLILLCFCTNMALLFCFCFLYVDDIILTGNAPTAITDLIANLASAFELKDLGPLKFFLGLQIDYKPSGFFVHQTNLVGALQYLTFTRPDLSFAVNSLCQHMQSPTSAHMVAAKRVLRYVRGSLSHGLLFQPGPMHLTVFTDADWAGNPVDRRSTTGFLVFLGNNLITWASKKQPTVSRSSTEAEYRSLAVGAAEVAWIRMLLSDLHVFLSECPLIWCDNTSAISLASNPVFHARTKHVEVDYHFVRERVVRGDLKVQFIPTVDQLADLLTKALPTPRFVQLANKLLHSFSRHPDRDKLIYILALLKLELVQKKVLIFTNTIDMGYRLKLFLEKFGIKSAILNAELPQNSRLHILEEFNAGLFDYLIATDDSQTKEKEESNRESNAEQRKSRKHAKQKLDSEFGVVRGIDFKNVNTVCE
uniref:CCHC-type domain-containing protein n=1 Tax=Fagus sylvatica TaxID=28930 RepID=A0A2N9IX43_FAGSY